MVYSGRNFTSEETLKRHCGGRNQVYRWINDVEYAFGNQGRCIARLYVVVCEETWEEISRTTGKTTSKEEYYASALTKKQEPKHMLWTLASFIEKREALPISVCYKKHYRPKRQFCKNNYTSIHLCGKIR